MKGDVSVTNSTDTLPFHNEQEAQAFCRLASRRFKFLLREWTRLNCCGPGAHESQGHPHQSDEGHKPDLGLGACLSVSELP
jgi:hypothetical protein